MIERLISVDRKRSTVFLVFIAALSTGCTSGGVLAPASPSVQNYGFEVSASRLFQGALTAAQHEGLDVAVIEKDSGLIRFESVVLTPDQLDYYCQYPYVGKSSGKPTSTFSYWNWWSKLNERGSVRGRMSITLLVSGGKDKSNLNVRSNWTASNWQSAYACNSKGVFESSFIEQIRRSLGP